MGLGVGVRAPEAAPRRDQLKSAQLLQRIGRRSGELPEGAPPQQGAGARSTEASACHLCLSPPSATSTVSSPCSGPLGPSPGPPRTPSWREPIKAGPCDRDTYCKTTRRTTTASLPQSPA
ncbi:carbonic anhydrase 2, isoform CRA_b [Rattus norvegicus]|uniref:Carbonic anhydrase 2, isoform CRA_b n=1 Tax=Rattus norvegicus TaxID=10116 RepID=A6IH10_RAT|nr:carbonic anhydrase 2, isoform CRA_b [Rattus norvegicus]